MTLQVYIDFMEFEDQEIKTFRLTEINKFYLSLSVSAHNKLKFSVEAVIIVETKWVT